MQLILIYMKKFFLSRRAQWRRFDAFFMYFGIIISVAALCTTIIIFEGYENTLKKTILGVNSHIYFFSNPSQTNLNEIDYATISEFLSTKPEVNKFNGALTGQAVASFRGKTSVDLREQTSVDLRGESSESSAQNPEPRISLTEHRAKGCFYKSVDWQDTSQASIYHTAVHEGTYELHNENDIVVGKYLAQMLGVGIGDVITILSTASANVGVTGVTYRTKEMRIVGIFYCGMYEYDSRYVFMNTETARHFDTTNSLYTMVEVQLKEDYINQADELAMLWDAELLRGYDISSWIDFNGNLFSLLSLQKWVLTFIISFLIVVASFNVITTTLASINEKRKEIGLLKTIGLSGKNIALLFLAQINMMAIVCIIVGILLGIGLGYLISYQTMISLRGEVYLLDKIYIYVDFLKMCLIFGIAFVIINISSILPIRQVSKLNEIEILRYRR